MEYSSQVETYRRRKPQETSLWKLLNGHFVEFEEDYDELFQKKYGFFRPVISHVVRKYLECGDLHQGFARIKCPDCHHQFILAFSCRGRWFCPSCHSKKVIQFGHHLKETVLYLVPHQHGFLHSQNSSQILSLRPQTAGQAQPVCCEELDKVSQTHAW